MQIKTYKAKSNSRKNKWIRESLSVFANIHFDNENGFCGQPQICLLTHKDNPAFGWIENQIGITIHDQDDYDIGFIYEPSSEKFFDILHELINWIHDLEQGLISFDNYISDIDNFFPVYDCKRIPW